MKKTGAENFYVTRVGKKKVGGQRRIQKNPKKTIGVVSIYLPLSPGQQ